MRALHKGIKEKKALLTHYFYQIKVERRTSKTYLIFFISFRYSFTVDFLTYRKGEVLNILIYFIF